MDEIKVAVYDKIHKESFRVDKAGVLIIETIESHRDQELSNSVLLLELVT